MSKFSVWFLALVVVVGGTGFDKAYAGETAAVVENETPEERQKRLEAELVNLKAKRDRFVTVANEEYTNYKRRIEEYHKKKEAGTFISSFGEKNYQTALQGVKEFEEHFEQTVSKADAQIAELEAQLKK